MLIVFLLTAGLLAIVQIKVATPMILAERFVPTFGWIEIFLLAIYAGWIAEKMLDPEKSAKVRYNIWLAFSIVFFSQLIIGLLGVDNFLMTGKLHLPIPAMILAGPIYRAERFFMPILFISTVLLVGPAWCSHLCYIGSWDAAASKAKKRPLKIPVWRHPARIGILIIVAATALILRMAGASAANAALFGAVFGIAGLGVMFYFSRKTGVMTHCTTYCPMGILANWVGKLSPFRMKIADGCTECRACTLVCRYDALNISDIQNRKPGLSCTLCGDCVASCKDGFINYRFLKMKPEKARILFIILVVSLHAVFMGVARI